MEAKTTKMIAAVAVIVMCAAGLVGAGYAYTASTVNEGNNASAEYLTITQGGTGAYQFSNAQNVYWNSEDLKVLEGSPLIGGNIAIGDYVTKYTMTSSTSTTDIPGITTVKVGNSFTLTVTPTGVAAAAGGVDAKISAENFLPQFSGDAGAAAIFLKFTYDETPGNYQYFKLTATNTFTKGTISAGVFTPVATEAENVLHFPQNNSSSYKMITASVYYSAPATGIVVEHAAGVAPEGPPSTIITNGKLSFTINANGGNNPGATPLQGFTVNKNHILIASNDPSPTQTATITFANEATNKTVNAVSSNPAVATVAVDGATVTVTKVAPGNATITLTAAEGDYQATIAVTVSGIVLTPAAVTGQVLNQHIAITATLYGDALGNVAWTGTDSYYNIAVSGQHNTAADVEVLNIGSGTVTATVTIDTVEFTATCTVNAA